MLPKLIRLLYREQPGLYFSYTTLYITDPPSKTISKASPSFSETQSISTLPSQTSEIVVEHTLTVTATVESGQKKLDFGLDQVVLEFGLILVLHLFS